MTRTTTGSSRLTVILSWMIALICFVGGALYIWKMPSLDQEAIALQMKLQGFFYSFIGFLNSSII